MYIDVKMTTWERIDVPEEIKEKVLESIRTQNTTQNIYEDFGIDSGPINDIFPEEMSTDENLGNSTIEIYENDQLIWQNGK